MPQSPKIIRVPIRDPELFAQVISAFRGDTTASARHGFTSLFHSLQANPPTGEAMNDLCRLGKASRSL